MKVALLASGIEGQQGSERDEADALERCKESGAAAFPPHRLSKPQDDLSQRAE